MKFKNTTLLITITTIITFQIALAGQLTINFENFVPDVPTTCNEMQERIWNYLSVNDLTT